MGEEMFLEGSVWTDVPLESDYATMAQEEVREAEALAWAEATLVDLLEVHFGLS